MNKTRLLAALSLIALASPSLAHRQWLLPSTTVVSGTDDWVTVDAAISNDLFFPDHFAMNTDGIKLWAPDGTPAQIENAAKGRYRATFDVHLVKPGTWKVGTVDSSVGGTFKVGGEDWSVGRRRGPPPGPVGAAMGAPGRAPGAARPQGGGEGGPRPTIAPGHSVATVAEIPASATDLKLTEMSSQNVVFLTAGAPTDGVFKPTNTGLEMIPITHPSALVSNEPGRFRFLVDGKPAAGLKVTVIPGGKRYRSSEDAQELTAGADGVLSVKWTVPGMYWLNATLTDGRATTPRATQRRMSYTTTLEVQAP